MHYPAALFLENGLWWFCKVCKGQEVRSSGRHIVLKVFNCLLKAKIGIHWFNWLLKKVVSVHTKTPKVGKKLKVKAGAGLFSPRHLIHTGSSVHTQPHPMGTGAPSLGVMRPEREGDPSPPSSVEINVWSCTSTPPYIFMACCLVKYRIRFHGMVLS
jgi:hypothetical protein